MSLKPDFLGVGAAKAGTTTLHDLLARHPDVFLPNYKEVHFFDMDINYSKGKDWYQDIAFKGHGSQKAIGEFSPSYMYFDHVPQRIADSYGTDIKLIFALRHPVDRAWSHYRMHLLRELEDLSFEQAIAMEEARLSNASQDEMRYYSYISRGHYASQIERFLAVFPRENFHFVLFENLISDKRRELARLVEFLGLDWVEVDLDVHSNRANLPRSRMLSRLLFRPARWKKWIKPWIPERVNRNLKHSLRILNEGQQPTTRLDPALRSELMDRFFADEPRRLSRLVGLDLVAWQT